MNVTHAVVPGSIPWISDTISTMPKIHAFSEGVRHRHLPPCNQDTTYTVYTLIYRRYRLYNCPWDRSHHKKQRQACSNLLSFPLLTLVSQTKLQQVARNPDTKSDQPLGLLACPSWLSRICSVLWSSWSWQAPVLVSAWCLSETPQLHPPPSSLPRMPKEDTSSPSQVTGWPRSVATAVHAESGAESNTWLGTRSRSSWTAEGVRAG